MVKVLETEILSLGEPLMEFSAEQEGTLDTVRSFASGFGGDASNFAVAAARAGGKVGMIARIGRDEFGDAFVSLWEGEGIDTSQVQRADDGPTGLYIITRHHGRHNFTYYRAGSAASRMTPDMLPVEAIRKAKLLHVTGVTQGISTTSCDTALAAMETAKEAGTMISYDPNYRPTLWGLDRARAVVRKSVSMADIVIPSIEEAEVMFGITDPEEAAAEFLSMGAGVVALKLGAQGALIATPESMERVPAIEVQAMDCSGAGDAFAGAFVASLIEGRSLSWAARYAIVAAGLSTLGLGCVAPIPPRERVMQFLDPDPDRPGGADER